MIIEVLDSAFGVNNSYYEEIDEDFLQKFNRVIDWNNSEGKEILGDTSKITNEGALFNWDGSTFRVYNNKLELIYTTTGVRSIERFIERVDLENSMLDVVNGSFGNIESIDITPCTEDFDISVAKSIKTKHSLDYGDMLRRNWPSDLAKSRYYKISINIRNMGQVELITNRSSFYIIEDDVFQESIGEVIVKAMLGYYLKNK